MKVKDVPAISSKILNRDKDGRLFDKSIHYRSLIGKLNYLEKSTGSNISYIVHQCARFTEESKEKHAKALRWWTRYFICTKDKGFIMKQDPSKGMEVYIDANFS